MSETTPNTQSLMVDELTSSYRLRRLISEVGSTITRGITVGALAEYEAEGIYSPNTLEVLSVNHTNKADQLQALYNASVEELKKAATAKGESGFRIVPHEASLGTNQNDAIILNVSAAEVTPVESTARQRLMYLPTVTTYYQQVLSDYVSILEGTVGNRVYHTDLVKPSQFVYGSVGNNQPALYMVDLDPELDAVAQDLGSKGTEISKWYGGLLADLATITHIYADDVPQGYPEQIKDLISYVISEGVLNNEQRDMVLQAQKDGTNLSADPITFQL